MVEYAFILLFESIIGAAQCMVERAMEGAMQRAIQKAKEESLKAGVKEGLSLGYESITGGGAMRCMASGFFSGFKSILMMATLSRIQSRMMAQMLERLPAERPEVTAEACTRNQLGPGGGAGGPPKIPPRAAGAFRPPAREGRRATCRRRVEICRLGSRTSAWTLFLTVHTQETNCLRDIPTVENLRRLSRCNSSPANTTTGGPARPSSHGLRSLWQRPGKRWRSQKPDPLRDHADGKARDVYNDARQQGMTDQQARQKSYDAWNDIVYPRNVPPPPPAGGGNAGGSMGEAASNRDRRTNPYRATRRAGRFAIWEDLARRECVVGFAGQDRRLK